MGKSRVSCLFDSASVRVGQRNVYATCYLLFNHYITLEIVVIPLIYWIIAQILARNLLWHVH